MKNLMMFIQQASHNYYINNMYYTIIESLARN
jgi:hypothetical protein